MPRHTSMAIKAREYDESEAAAAGHQLVDTTTQESNIGATCELLTLELTMVPWMPLSLTLMVICLSERSGLMNGG